MGSKGEGGKMKLECIKDVVMNVSEEKAFTKGNTYNGYYYRGRDSINPYHKVFCSKNDLGERHCIKNPESKGLDKFFDEHFREIRETSYWDLARTLLSNSNCLKRQYACVIVSDGRIIATGYNKSLEGCTVCAREGIEHNVGDYTECRSVHAEQMGLINAPQNLLKGAELYLVCADEVDPIPCPTCAKLLKWAGVKLMREVDGH